MESGKAKVAGGYRALLIEGPHNIYLPNIIEAWESRRMRCAGNVAHMTEMRNDTK
jgi:hypothetical protein